MTTAVTRTDDDRCYRAVRSRDPRFDGVFYTAVKTTGIYCRPSCPAITPRRRNVEFYASAAAAQHAGFRACRRCLPDATPGSPEWDMKADVAGRAMRLIADGVVEREGVDGLASRTGYTPRHLGRLLQDQLGAGPLALARTHRAHTARILIETTDLGFADVAFAAGFASIRQFNETVRQVYAATPTQLRSARRGSAARGRVGSITVSLPVRRPFDGRRLLAFLAARAVPGVEAVNATTYERTMSLPHGPGRVTLTLGADSVRAEFALTDLRDLATAVERSRRTFDLDADPVAIAEQLVGHPILGGLVAARPGLRVPGHVDGFEVAVRAVVGQQVSVAGARTVIRGLVERFGTDYDTDSGVPRVFPTAAVVAEADPETLPMPRARGRALVAVAAAVAAGAVVLDRGADRDDVRDALLALPGVGPWTADYIAMRALGDPDVWLGTDLGVIRALEALGHGQRLSPDLVDTLRPWRSYAVMHLWHHLNDPLSKGSP